MSDPLRRSHYRSTLEQKYLQNRKVAMLLSCVSETVVRRCSLKKVFLVCLILKETATQLISCENCKSFKNNYFEEYLLTAASDT